jgi:hypothetical protein
MKAGDQLGLRCVLAGGTQHPRRCVLLCEQVHQQRAAVVVAVQFLDGPVVEGQQLAGTHQQPLALGGERYPAGGTGEQAHPEVKCSSSATATKWRSRRRSSSSVIDPATSIPTRFTL